MKRIVIVGGTGFIGEYLVRALSGEAGMDVVYRGGAHENIAGVSYHKTNGRSLKATLREVLPGADALAILTPPAPSLMSDERHHKSLIMEILHAAEDARTLHILYASTFLLYRGGAKPQREDAPLEAHTPYEKAKLAEETTLREWGKAHPERGVTIARIGSVYGDVKNKGVIGNLMRALFTGETVSLAGGGSGMRDFIFVEDVAQALAALLLRETKPGIEVFNVTTGKGYAVTDVVAAIERIAGKRPSTSDTPAVDETPAVIGDSGKFHAETKWKSQYDLKEGLRKTYQNYFAKFNK